MFTSRILVVRFSSAGDIVLTTPVLRCAKNQWHGEVEIHFLTKKPYAFLLENNPHVHRVHTIERSTNEIIGTLRDLQFDYIIDLHHNARSYFLKRKLGTLTFSFNKLNFEKWLLVRFGLNRLPKVHIVDRYLETLSAFKIKNDQLGLDYFIPEAAKNAVLQVPEAFRKGYLAFVIGGQHKGKKLPPEKIARICKTLNCPVILLGGPEDEDAANTVLVTAGEKVWSAAGKFSFDESAALIESSAGVISHDTGLMHVAAALKKPVISVWGGTVPEFGMYPYLPGEPSAMVQASHLKKRPCSKLGNHCKYKTCRCTEEINENEVVQHAQRVLQGGV